jgi:hypothetical protein
MIEECCAQWDHYQSKPGHLNQLIGEIKNGQQDDTGTPVKAQPPIVDAASGADSIEAGGLEPELEAVEKKIRV